MSTEAYQASLKGKLVTVDADVSVRVYSSGALSAKTAEFITGPTTAGTATGTLFTDGSNEFIEVLRAKGISFMGIPNISKIYLNNADVTTKENPLYGKTTNPATPTGGTTPDDDSDEDVTKTPGKNRVPVETPEGDVVYKKVPEGGTTPSDEPAPTPNKWLTYGLYAVIALGVATLITLLVISLKKPKTSGPRPALSK